MTDQFQAVLLTQEDKKTISSIATLATDDLPQSDVLVDVAYSTLNYKDGLAITGAGKIVRNFPFVPGIDFAGTVLESQDDRFAPGDEVILTGFGVGERHWGGLAGRARVKADWLVKKPEGLSLKHCMAVGTAGLTAMLSVLAIEDNGVSPDKGEIVVTGASGGVGSVALSLLNKAGYKAVASTGRASLEGYLKELGASSIIDRDELTEPSKAPLSSERWAGAIDTVGSETLAGILRSAKYHAVVAACGLAGGFDLPTTVFPFILRGVKLIGIDSVYCPLETRDRVWQRIAQDLDTSLIDRMTTVKTLQDVPELAPKFLQGQIQGRVVIDTKSA